jgi:uncharacterized protein (DUF58 family)
MMRRLLVLGLVLYGLLFAGLSSLNGRLVALAIPVVVYLGAALLADPGRLRLRATRTLSERRVQQGARVWVSVMVTNEGRALADALIGDVVPAHLTVVDGAPTRLLSLAPGQTAAIEYCVHAARGEYDFDHVTVSAGDHFGLIRRRATLSEPGRLIVLPEAAKARRVEIRPLRTRGYAGPVPARQGGSGVEFFGVREYQPGDPLRRINWRASARYPQGIFTNEYRQERIADVGIILDARMRSDVLARGDSLFEHSVRAAATLGDAFLADGNRVGLLVYGSWLDWTLPGYGKVQRQRILDALARAKTGDSLVFESLDHLPTRLFPPGAQLVLISPLFRDDVQMLLRLLTRGYQLLVVSPDPIAFEVQRPAVSPEVALAARIARLERRLILTRLGQAGVRVADWRVDASLEQALHAAAVRSTQRIYTVGWER